MRWIYAGRLRLRSLFRSSQVEAELDEELRDHIDRHVELLIGKGMLPDEARSAAIRAMGGVDQQKEACRDARAVRRIEDLLRDIGYSARLLRRAPGFTAVAVLSLALGIGANTAIFSIVNAVLLRPLPYGDPERLAMLWTDDPAHAIAAEGVSIPNFDDWRTMSRSFVDMAISSRRNPVTLTGELDPIRVEAALVSPNLFPVLGVAPAAGRVFAADELERRERSIVISHGLWTRRFGASVAALGQSLEVNGASWRIVGVMPRTFQFPSAEIELWMPLTSHPRWSEIARERFSDFGLVIGRLRAGVTLAEARTEMSAIGRRLEAANPPTGPDAADFAGYGVNVVPLSVQVLGTQLPLALWMLFGAVLFVLLIACANVTNLLLARGSARAREIAVRAALGAARGRILQQLLTESLLLALAACVVGVGIAAGGLRLLTALGAHGLPRVDETGLDPRVFVFTIVVTLAATLLVGLAPAVGLSNTSALSRHTMHGTGSGRLRRSIVILEFALCAVLLCGAGLLARSLFHLEGVDPGFRPERVLTMRVQAVRDRARSAAFFAQVVERLQATPGVTAAGFIEDLLQRRNPDYNIRINGRPAAPAEAISGDAITPGCFEALGVRLLRGRLFSGRDGNGSPRVAIVNDTFARHFWPGEDPIGRQFSDADETGAPTTVVGVVSDMRRQGLERAPIAQIFWPSAQRSTDAMDLVVRTTSDPSLLTAVVRSEIRSVDRQAVLFNVAPLDDRLHEALAPQRLQSVLLAVFSGIALLLATIGIYGVMHYAVAQRTRDIAIRTALGARRAEILALVLREGLSLAAAGVALGLAGALALTRVLRGLVYGVSTTDPLTFVATGLGLTAVALMACYVPARRAARVDPMVALRCE